MPIDVQMPDGTIISGVPDNITQADLLARYKAFAPQADASGAVPDELGRYDAAKQSGSRRPEDISALERNIAAGKRGFESLGDVKAGLGLAGTAITGTDAETAAKMQQIKQDQAKPQETPGLTAADIERIYKEKGFSAAASQVPSYISEQILASAPQMAIPLTAGAAAGAVSGPFAPVVAPLVGIGTYGIQQFGNFLTRQAVEKNDPKELELGKAAMTAGATAPLGYFADRFTAGLGGLGAKKAGTEILKELSARQVAAKVGKRTVVGATEGIIAEAPLEVLEQAAERYQAGLSLTGDDATNEYKEAFFGAAGAGAGIGGASRGVAAYQKPVKPGQPPEIVPPEEQIRPPKEPMIAPVGGSQDTQAMIDEFQGKPVAPVQAQPVGTPEVAPVTTPEAKPTTEPLGNVWENIQNRDRSTPASVAQMSKIANQPDYSRVSVSRDYGTGAPIVSGAEVNPTQVGRKDVVTGSDGKKVPVQYAVIEAGEVIPSHNADGTKNPSYVDPSVTAFRAITNGRVAGLQAAYNQGTAEGYKADLMGDDLHGIDKSVIEGMKNPMLVRVMPMDQVNKNTGDVSNTGAGLSFNVVEQAKNDTNRIDLAKVSFTDSGDISPQTVQDFIKAMPDTERGNLMGKDGAPTKQAVERLNAAVFQQAYGNDKLTELAFQAQDEEARNIVRALNMAASKAIRLGEAGDYDVRPLVNEAVELAINARRNNISLSDAAKQVDMTANPLANDIIQMFADNSRSAKAIGENLSNLFDGAFAEGSKSGEDMFGAVPKRPVDQLVKESFAKKVEPDLFAEPEKAPAKPTKKPVAKPAPVVSSEPKQFQAKKSVEQIAKEIEALTQGSQVAEWLVENAPNEAAKAIADRLLVNIKAIEDSGVPIKIEVLNGAKRNNYYGASGLATGGTKNIQYFKVVFNGLNAKGQAEYEVGTKEAKEGKPTSTKPTGTRYSTLMHELLHVISQVQLDALIKRNFKGPEKVIYNELRSIYNAVRDQIVLDKKNTPYDQRHPLLKEVGINNNRGIMLDIHELFVRSLTEKNVQSYLSTVKMGNKSALTKLIKIFRKVIGLNPDYQSALDRIMIVSDKIFAQTPKDMQRLAQTEGYNFPTMKKEGQLKTTSPQFKKWFKDSKVVDKDGKPLVMYHGTEAKEDFDIFDTERKSLAGKGSWFSVKPSKSYASGEGARVIPAYLSIKNPYMHEGSYDSFNKEKLISEGYDGVIVTRDGEIQTAVAYNPTQIKSSIGNTGEFNVESPNIRYEEVTDESSKEKPPAEARNYLGKQIQANWAFPEDNVKHWPGMSDESIDNFIYKIQDKQIDTKRAQQAIEKAAGEIEENINVYDKEQLYHGRTATGIREFLLNELMPAIKDLGKLNLTPQDLKDYLHNRHAEERNNKMNEVNKLDPITGKERTTPWDLQDRASGISTKDAREYLANLDPSKKSALEKVAKQFDDMVKGTQDILVESGAEDQATVDAWNDTYKNYVPLFRVEDDFAKTGGFGPTGASKGFGTRGSFSKRAMGSEKEVQDILGNLIAQRERALIRAEKLKVGKALYGLSLMNPNPDVWLPVNPDAIKSKDALIAELKGLGFEDANSIADNLMQEPKSRYISKEKKQFIDPATGLPVQVTEESVKLKIDNLKRFGDNVFPVRINGKDRYIFFNKNNPQALRMVHSLMNLDADALGDVEGIIGKATRWFASVNTQYNPIFGAVNLIRDVGGANFNLTSTAIAGEQAKVTKGVIPAMRGILNVLRDERKGKTDTTGKWAQAFQEFRKEGGQTGYRDSLIRTDEEKQVIEKELNKMKSGNAKKAFSAVMGALSDFNDMMENSVRVSAYVAARDKGMSKQKAAVLAKNLTVNFDKKGQLSARINAYYAFFNASVQGTARLAQTLKGPKGKAIIGGGIALGAAQAVLLAAAGYRDDEPPEFIRQRNFIVPLPDGKFITIPYPLGLHVLPNMGRITTEFVLGGGKDAAKKITDMTGAVADAFSPIGSSGLSMQTILPTVADPLAALEANKDAFGRPIYKKDQATNPTPGYMRSRESASEISKSISYFLNLASGGSKYSKGFISPTADEIDYVVGQVTGGVGRELMKAEQTIKGAVTGEEVPAYKVPLAGRFYGETESNAAESARFYNNIIKMADYENEIKGRIKDKEPVGPYLKDNPQARFWQMANTTENQINALNKQKKEFIEKGLPKDRIKRIENQKATIMKRFNDHIAKYED